MTKQIYICEICSAETAKKICCSFAAKYGQMNLQLKNIERFQCNNCGEEYFDVEQEKILSRKVKALARQELGLLSPRDIIAIREKYSLSQERLEWLLHLGAKVVTRWENDRVLQPRPVDDLLRLMDKLPSIVEELSALRQTSPENSSASI